MIKKILLFVLCGILAYGLYSAFAHGISVKMFGQNIDTKSYSDIAKLSEDFVNKRQELINKNDVEYPQALARQEAAKSNFKANKATYEETALKASPAEIRQANQKVVYYLDYLWIKIGTYANDNDVKVLINPEGEGSNAINFDVSGQYIAVINFIYDIQSDDELGFNVDNLVMMGGSTDAITNARFRISNINVITSPSEVN